MHQTLNIRTPRSRSEFTAQDLRLLRASLSAFMDMLALATRTLETFGEGA